MTVYFFDINSGTTPGDRTYLAELQSVQLTELQEGLDDEELLDLFSDWDKPEREQLENGCLGWGPYSDQNLVVWTEVDGEEMLVDVIPVEEWLTDNQVFDCVNELNYDTPGRHIVACHTEKGNYSGQLEITTEFDRREITFSTLNVADDFCIVTGVRYGSEDIDMEGDSTGKGVEHFVYENDCLESL